MNRPRLGERPESMRPKVIEALIVVGCITIVSLLAKRTLGAVLTDSNAPHPSNVVILDSPDSCLGGLCSAPPPK